MHRWLGILFCLIFTMWFISGLVMMYHTFPRVTQSDRLVHMEPLSLDSLPSWSEIEARAGGNVQSVRLDRYLGQTVFHLNTKQGNLDLPADSDEVLPIVDSRRINQVANLWCKAPVKRIDTLNHLEQWIPFGRLRAEFPIYKFHFDDEEKTELYISSRTGDVLQLTNQKSRFWAWLGAIPHWIYITSLRQDAELWRNVVIALSAVGCFMCIAGIYVGIYYTRLARKQGKVSPYRKKSYLLHHLLGLVFGVFVLTFCFSGMMSLADVRDWGIRSHLPFHPLHELRKQQPAPGLYTLDYRNVLKRDTGTIKQIEWGSFGSIPFYIVRKADKTEYIDARGTQSRMLSLQAEDILPEIRRVHGNDAIIQLSLLEEYDTYYFPRRKQETPLPVYKVTIEDTDKSTYYINPHTGSCRYIDTPSRWMHWLYPALHSLNTHFFSMHPVLREIVLWILMLGGTGVSVTGVWLGVRHIRRMLRK